MSKVRIVYQIKIAIISVIGKRKRVNNRIGRKNKNRLKKSLRKMLTGLRLKVLMIISEYYFKFSLKIFRLKKITKCLGQN